MVYRNSEFGMMDWQWPHQVGLPAMRCHGHNYVTMRLFCETLSLSPRTHLFRRGDDDITDFSFAEHAHAEKIPRTLRRRVSLSAASVDPTRTTGAPDPSLLAGLPTQRSLHPLR